MTPDRERLQHALERACGRLVGVWVQVEWTPSDEWTPTNMNGQLATRPYAMTYNEFHSPGASFWSTIASDIRETWDEVPFPWEGVIAVRDDSILFIAGLTTSVTVNVVFDFVREPLMILARENLWGQFVHGTYMAESSGFRTRRCVEAPRRWL